MRAVLCSLVVLTVLPASSIVHADYPERPVAFVVPYAAGGATDLLARMLAQRLEQHLGKPFLVENRPGASSAVAAAYVAKAPADGYTMLMATSTTMAINTAVFKKLAYRPLVDLAPVALIATSPFVLVVRNSLPAAGIAGLVRLAQDRPGALTYGSSGPGSAHHLDMQLLASMTGIKLTHVAYKGSVPALNDVVAGHIDMMFADMSSALPLIRVGSVRALGVSPAHRLEGAPDLPTIAEAGVPGYDASAWQMVVMATATPKDILDKVAATLAIIQNDPELRAIIVQRGMGPLASRPRPELEQFVRDEIARWSNVVREAGVAETQ
ncbi:MAG: tripartite tricarboxylate transporter substrate binding protein [Hyphomicrobiales bacterium]|nr:tripartite tricarboxylate transporter substrate binding protein [Hyphomicrobiales bacterium]